MYLVSQIPVLLYILHIHILHIYFVVQKGKSANMLGAVAAVFDRSRTSMRYCTVPHLALVHIKKYSFDIIGWVEKMRFCCDSFSYFYLKIVSFKIW
jgi:hypothetical protein